MRLIDAEKLQKHFENCIVECKNTNSYSEDFEIALSATKNQPTIETESVRYVKWIHDEEWIAHCSECGEEMLSTDISNYCPKCGVKMEEKMHKELKPCPFCGSNELTIDVSTAIQHKRKAIEYTAYVECAKCLAKGGVIREELRVHLFGDVIRFEIIDEKFMERAIEIWNKRAIV